MKRIKSKAFLLVVLVGAAISLAPRGYAAAQPEATPGQETVVTRGQDLYETNCATCHGYEGKGNGPIAKAFSPAPADLTKAVLKFGMTDAEITKNISDGIAASAMQAWKPKLSDDDIQAILGYVKELRKASDPK